MDRQVFLKTLLVLVLASATVAAYAKDVALISNKSNAVGTITTADLIKVCKAQTTRWPDGAPITLVIRDPGSAEMKMVVEKIYGMTVEALRELIATANHGRANRPAILVVDSDEAVIRRVESAPGAVGFVDVYSITGAVNVMKIDGKPPFEPGYLLHGN